LTRVAEAAVTLKATVIVPGGLLVTFSAYMVSGQRQGWRSQNSRSTPNALMDAIRRIGTSNAPSRLRPQYPAMAGLTTMVTSNAERTRSASAATSVRGQLPDHLA
jgi:hypothetical protein